MGEEEWDGKRSGGREGWWRRKSGRRCRMRRLESKEKEMGEEREKIEERVLYMKNGPHISEEILEGDIFLILLEIRPFEP